MTTRHLGRVLITEELLLGILQFAGGSIYAIEKSVDMRTLRIVIEHPDMPKAYDGIAIYVVHLSYTYKHDENGQLLSMERISPTKASGEEVTP